MSLIKKIRIKNFKSLEEVEIEIKPLTFLFGPNGSGKSSFMKALIFLQKNLFPVNSKYTQYKLSNELDLVSFDDCVYNADRKREISFEIILEFNRAFPDEKLFDFENNLNYYNDKKNETEDLYDLNDLVNGLNYNFFVEYSRIENLFDFDYDNFIRKYQIMYEFSFSIIFSFIYDEKGKNFSSIKIKENNTENYIEYNLKEIGHSLISEEYSEESYSVNVKFFEKYEYCNFFLHNYFHFAKNNFFGNYELPFITKKDFVEGKLLSPLNFNVEEENRIINDWLEKDLSERTKLYFEFIKFTYIAIVDIPKRLKSFLNLLHLPITREIPKQKYLLINNKFSKSDYYGFLYSINSESDDIGIPEEGPFIDIDQVNMNLERLKLHKKFNILLNNDIGSLFFTDKHGNKVNLANESSGLIQVFPIVLSLSIDPQKPLILIEQPELHLHPKLQASLANLLINNIKSYEKSKSIIIETHSEHLVRKIQVLIAKEELEKDKVGIWYFDNSEEITKVKEMIIETNGFFKEPWPNGFFDDSANLSWELLTTNKN